MSRIEQLSLDAQTEIIAHGLESSSSRAFLERMPAVETLMPPLEVGQIQQLVDAKRAERRALGYVH